MGCAPHPWKTPLREHLAGAVRIALLGVGSELRGDDAVGVLVAQRLARRPPLKSPAAGPRATRMPRSAAYGRPAFRVFVGGTAPENLTGEIKRFRPTHLIIVDAAEFAQAPGTVRLIDPENAEGVTFSTHSLPLSVLAGYLRQHFPCAVAIVGVQPGTLTFGATLSPPVRRAASRIVSAIRDILSSSLTTRDPRDEDRV